MSTVACVVDGSALLLLTLLLTLGGIHGGLRWSATRQRWRWWMGWV